MLMPKKVKHRKQHRGRMTGKAWLGSSVSFGDYGLRAMEPCWLTDRQIEAARVAMTRFIKRGGKIWIRVFPDKPITKKPQETRMGKGGATTTTRPMLTAKRDKKAARVSKTPDRTNGSRAFRFHTSR